ncbi:MAG: hypothetical protein V2A70_09730 [Candidatus Omnitrophota bacterium]
MKSASVINAALELRDIRGPVAIPGEWLWLWIILGVLFLTGVVFVMWRHFKHPRVVPLAPPRPAWEVALESLLALEQGVLVAEGRIKDYYAELSGVVRWYIEERFELRAPEMTTEEFMDEVRHSDKLTKEHQKFLEDFLNASDMVKFARFVPSEPEMRQGLRLARTFVEETR